MINDAPVVFDDPALEGVWRPENYSGKFYGPTRMREALVKSRNLVSVRILISLGLGYALRYVERFGFDREQLPRDLSLVLGSGTVTPLQIATGYAVFANGGYLVEPYFIERIENGEGETVFQAQPTVVCSACEARDAAALEVSSKGENPEKVLEPAQRLAPRVISERNAYVMRSMLRDVVSRGTGVRARSLGRQDIAGKTGTTNDQHDTWFSGFNSKLVASTWLGFDGQIPLGARETGGRAALPMWVDFMKVALEGIPEDKLVQPNGLVTMLIDSDTGELTTAENPNRMFEIFREEDTPVPTLTPVVSPGDSPNDPSTIPEQLF